jgi:hypothetical protein
MGLITFLKKIFKSKRCIHRFDASQVLDFNTDPKCTRCGMYFTAIVSKGRYYFQSISETEYELKKGFEKRI